MDSRDNLPHPMQPIGLDELGTPRFKENKIVSLLLHNGKFDLNALSMLVHKGMASKEDYTHLMQLIGYSVSGYGDLSTSPPELVEKADRIADRVVKEAEGVKCTCDADPIHPVQPPCPLHD